MQTSNEMSEWKKHFLSTVVILFILTSTRFVLITYNYKIICTPGPGLQICALGLSVAYLGQTSDPSLAWKKVTLNFKL